MKTCAASRSDITFQKQNYYAQGNSKNTVYAQNGFNINQFNRQSYTPNNKYYFAKPDKPLPEKRLVMVIPDADPVIKHAASIPTAKITVGETAKQSGHGAFLMMHNLRVAFDDKVLKKLPNWLKKTIIIGGTTGGTLALASGCSGPGGGTPAHPTPTPIVITTPTPIPTPVPGVGQSITNTLEPLGIIQSSSSSSVSSKNGTPDVFSYAWSDCDEYGNIGTNGYTQAADLAEGSTPDMYKTAGTYKNNATGATSTISEAFTNIEGGYKLETTKSTGTRFNAYKRFGDEVRVYKMENGTIGDLLERMVKGKVAGVVEFIGKDGSYFRKYTRFILR